ncbi:penicillin acylase family protein [Metapseudomonas resinovorans]|uniref:Peptidase S45 family protein n=1 Tax=Metapseudomonas resinovorans NBRC 106553 TaxID=1245471 RepID=S6AFJ4_METRE|nr:penicillin acylase family protein [Pseudomonas resinovorans]BAN48762.1 peptidase S45 family protein [Pseudomonas resinovorans NBRC 106553]
MRPSFQRKLTAWQATALCAALLAPTLASAGEVTIRRDSFGTAHVYADEVHGLFYGYGYAIAQDRLYQLEMSRRSTQGSVAEVLGQEYLKFDIGIRQNYSPKSIRLQLAKLPKTDLDILDGYAAGINGWIDEIHRNPAQLMPKQFIDNGFEPEKWTAFDVAMVFIGSMINRFGDYNTELDNQQLQDGLIAKNGEHDGKALFNLLLSVDNPNAPTTVPKGEWNPALRAGAYVPAKAAQAARPAAASTQALASSEPFQLQDAPKERAFSNIIVLGAKKTADARAILLNGPQFGFYQPAYTYSIGLHGAGYDAVGNSPFGYPMVEFGYNRDISWGSTWGAGDNVDLYRLQLNPQNPREYLFQGRYRPFETRTETIAVKAGKPERVTLYRSVQGAVVDYRPEQGVAYAKRRGWEGEEVATLMAWNKVGKARDHEQWAAQVSQSAINVNWYYADQRGNIGYALGGRYPVRVQGHDHRLPVPGNGDYEWQGFMPFASNPQVYNPSTGYIANWNNRPAEGFPSPDEWWYSWNDADRVKALFSRLEARERFTPQQAWDLMMDAAFEDPNARFFVPRLVKVASASDDPRLREAADILAHWNYQDRDNDADQRYDSPATPIFRAWLKQMLALSQGDALPAQQAPWFLETGYLDAGASTPGSQNIEVGTKVVHQAMQARESGKTGSFDLFRGKDVDALMLQALRQGLDDLGKTQGADMQAWRSGVAHITYAAKNFLGVPQAENSEEMRIKLAMNRGTENNLTVFTAKGVEGYEVVAPGQSGFIAPDGARSKHFDDQLKLYGDLDKKRTWLQQADVEANSTETIRLSY